MAAKLSQPAAVRLLKEHGKWKANLSASQVIKEALELQSELDRIVPQQVLGASPSEYEPNLAPGKALQTMPVCVPAAGYCHPRHKYDTHSLILRFAEPISFFPSSAVTKSGKLSSVAALVLLCCIVFWRRFTKRGVAVLSKELTTWAKDKSPQLPLNGKNEVVLKVVVEEDGIQKDLKVPGLHVCDLVAGIWEQGTYAAELKDQVLNIPRFKT